MKPCTAAMDPGQLFLFPFQIQGVSRKDVATIFVGSSIQACAMPSMHSFEAAWLMRVILRSGWSIEFSSTCNEIKDWQEIGSLNFSFSCVEEHDVPGDWIVTRVNAFHIQAAERLVYEDKDVRVECGLVLVGQGGDAITIAAGASPGSVSIKAPFSKDSFQPELEFSQYQRLPFLDVFT